MWTYIDPLESKRMFAKIQNKNRNSLDSNGIPVVYRSG